jgi:hypothetical protein
MARKPGIAVSADNDHKLPRRLSLAGPQRTAICHRLMQQKPAARDAKSALESRFATAPESAFADLEKG